VGQVFAELVWMALIAAVTYWCVAGRPADPLNRALQKMGCVFMGAIALYAVPLFNAFGVSAHDVVSSCVIALTAAAGLLRRRRSRHEDPPPKARFQVDYYLIAVAALAAWHLALSQLAAGLADSDTTRAIEATPDLTDDAVAKVTAFIFFFCASQMSTGALHKGFAASLQRDWSIAEGSWRRRPALLGLAALPVVACIPLAVMTGALLSGLLVRLAIVVIAYWMTRDLPRDRDAEFLSWSVFTTAKILLRRSTPSGPVP
jgi:hypothetical protein